ncbi:MAG: ATP-binding SpoIIE family protein phosphatase [Pseudomonadota bacterium]
MNLAITESSQVTEARRLTRALTGDLGFSDVEMGKAALVVTELGGNLVKHATGGGELIIRPLAWEGVSGIEILSLDKGPGLARVAEALRDGYSSAGTTGTGLGAVKRISSFFDIHSLPGKGSAVLACLWSKLLPKDCYPFRHQIGAVNAAKTGEEISGDDWAVNQQLDRTLILVADGLGHGPLAAEASGTAARIFRENPGLSPAGILELLHGALKSTRGAAVAVADVDETRQEVRFAGVGNISGTILSVAGSRSLVSHNGTLGYEARKIQEMIYPWPKEAILILHSDGMTARWDLESYPGLLKKHPSLIVGVLYRDFKRGSDDITVVAVRAADRLRDYNG